MGKGNVAALSYADVTDWREYDTRLQSALHLAALDPVEERWSWGDVSVHVDGRLSERFSSGSPVSTNEMSRAERSSVVPTSTRRTCRAYLSNYAGSASP